MSLLIMSNSLETRSTSALFKRAEQLKRWGESDTCREPPERRNPANNKKRIQFTDGCVFLAACAAADKDEVERLTERGADIDTANVDGLTALHQVRPRGTLLFGSPEAMLLELEVRVACPSFEFPLWNTHFLKGRPSSYDPNRMARPPPYLDTNFDLFSEICTNESNGFLLRSSIANLTAVSNVRFLLTEKESFPRNTSVLSPTQSINSFLDIP